MLPRILVVVFLISILLQDLLDAQDHPDRNNTLKQQKKELKDSRKKIKQATKKWEKNWKKTNKLKKIKLTKKQEDYWRKLAEYDEEDEPDDNRKRSVPDQDLRILSRTKRSGPLIPGPRKRRMEWRHMKDNHKQSFINAVNSLGAFIPDPVNDPTTSAFDIFVRWHRFLNAPGAHAGASFLPWHREFLWRFYNALRRQGYRRDIPYFDSALDQFLPEPRDSAFWSPNEHGLGVDRGQLGAPFNSSATTQIPECFGGATVTRLAREGTAARSFLYDRVKYATIMSKISFSHLTIGFDPDMERFHNTGHVFVGGTMLVAACSPGDPVFWLHHCNVDCLWEEYRQNVQHSACRALEYPLEAVGSSPSAMSWNSPMRPFDDLGLLNIHGLSNHYGSYYYECLPRPSSIICDSHSDCTPNNVTAMLWCDVNTGFCVAKIREDGECNRTWPDEQCFCPNGGNPSCGGNSRCNC